MLNKSAYNTTYALFVCVVAQTNDSKTKAYIKEKNYGNFGRN